MYKRIIILVIAAAFIILSLSACKREARDAQLAVIHPDYYISPGGILYEDIKNVSYKCYFDFESRSNLLLCYDPECAHSSISCLARQNHPYTFFTADKLYYLAIDLLTFIDNSQAVITGIYESDITKPEPKLLLEFEGSPVSEIYYRDNMLYVPAVIQKYDKAGTSSVQYCIYRINLKKNKLARSDIPLKGGFNEKYIPSGLIDNKLILQHSYYDRIISPSDYGLKGDATDLVSNKENYAKYRQELMKAAHEDMYYYDLGSGKLRSLDLPVPLLVHGGRYYYNKKSDEGFSLFSLQLD